MCVPFVLHAAISSAALAGPVGDFGFDFVTIGDPGNPAWAGTGDPVFDTFDRAIGRGGVGYEFRIMRTEVTATQWFEFVLAYAPYIGDEFRSRLEFTSSFITFIGPGADGVPRYRLNLGGDDLPVNVGWRFAARYCNWLHNGKAPDRAAFEAGAYDTSTFGEVDTGSPGFPPLTDQSRHTLGARFWIPTVDEWTKAAYWDPNKDGPGTGGWWTQPNGSDEPLIPGLPGAGQTSAGVQPGPELPVGSYPKVNKPWGLLDTSGGEREWLEDYASEIRNFRVVKGTNSGALHHDILDRISEFMSDLPNFSTHGLRLASLVLVENPGDPDLNGDGVVNGLDLLVLLSAWGPCVTGLEKVCFPDLSRDGRVDAIDLVVLLEKWSPQP